MIQETLNDQHKVVKDMTPEVGNAPRFSRTDSVFFEAVKPKIYDYVTIFL